MADISLTETNAQLNSDAQFIQDADVNAQSSVLTIQAASITQSVNSVVVTDSAVVYQANSGDMALAQINSQGAVTLEAAGKVLSVLDSSTATNVTAQELSFVSAGHFVDHETLGFVNATAALDVELLKVEAEVFVDGGINGSVKQVVRSADTSYLVDEEFDTGSIYLQFMSQNNDADYTGMADDKLALEQMELALSRFVTTDKVDTEISTTIATEFSTASEPATLLERVLQEIESSENNNKNDAVAVDSYDYLTHSSDSVQQENQSTISTGMEQTYFERQLEESILGVDSQAQAGSSDALLAARSSDSTTGGIGSFRANIVNSFGNRQINVSGAFLNDYSYDYFLDREEEVLINTSL